MTRYAAPILVTVGAVYLSVAAIGGACWSAAVMAWVLAVFAWINK